MKNVADPSVQSDPIYQKFMKENPSVGYLKVRASSLGGAIPVSGIRVQITRKIDDIEFLFFEGETDSSGMINHIALPAPAPLKNDEVIPKATQYEMKATGSVQNVNRTFLISIYPGITVIQYINVVPMMNGIVR